MFSKRTLIQMRMELLCKINTATNKSYEKYLIKNTSYIDKFIYFMFQREELKTNIKMSPKIMAWCERSLKFVRSFFTLIGKFLL